MLLLLIAAKRNLPRLHEDWRISEISSSKTAAETGPRNRVLKSFQPDFPGRIGFAKVHYPWVQARKAAKELLSISALGECRPSPGLSRFSTPSPLPTMD